MSDATAIRQKLRDNGYSPVPAAGKAAVLRGWPELCTRQPHPAEIGRWGSDPFYQDAINTGLACSDAPGGLVAVDLDFLEPDLAEKAEALALEELGESPLVRVGQWPKRAVLFRHDGTVRTLRLKAADGSGNGVDVLAGGAMLIGHGVHPVTGLDYEWTGGGTPWDTPLASLPEITGDQVRRLLERISNEVVPLATGGGGGTRRNGQQAGVARGAEIVRNEAGLVVDGREAFLARCVWDVVTAACRGGVADADDVARIAWDRFAKEADLSRRRENGKPWGFDDALAKARAAMTKVGTEQPSARPAAPAWGEPDPRLLRAERPPAPELPLEDVLPQRLARWVRAAAEGKGAPPDYVFAALVAVAGAAIGNSRWVSPWRGWTEPPVIWCALIGLPSAGKSPAIEAVTSAFHRVERPLRERAEAERHDWVERAEVAKLAEAAWRDEVKASLKTGEPPPPRPAACDPGPEPHAPRLLVNDTTIERLGAILARQPRGTLQVRDELAGWLEGMTRYSGGSDRPFWIEAYGGRSFVVERMNREPLMIARLTAGVLGSLQPDRLKTLLLKSDDDGLLARFWPVWPEPAPVRRPLLHADDDTIDGVIGRLVAIEMEHGEDGQPRPWFVPFDEVARGTMDEFRRAVRGWEGEADGLLLSFVGKLPGMAARFALVLAFLEWAAAGGEEPRSITVEHFGRAAHLVESYLVPMARRSYSDASVTAPMKSARRLVALIRAEGWQTFSSRDVLRLERAGLTTAAELDPALVLLEEGEVIRPIKQTSGRTGGRPARLYEVNPAAHGGVA